MNSDDRPTSTTTKKINSAHIIDHVLFSVVSPNLERLQAHLKQRLLLSSTSDPDLSQLYLDRQSQHRHSAPITRVLNQLVADFEPLIDHWVSHFRSSLAQKPASASTDTATPFARAANDHYDMYTRILPCETSDAVVQEWSVRRAPHEPTTWELLKASAFFSKFHARRMALVWLMAGRELCWMRSMQRGESRVVVGAVHAVYKPKREKVIGVGRGQPAETWDEGIAEDGG